MGDDEPTSELDEDSGLYRNRPLTVSHGRYLRI